MAVKVAVVEDDPLMRLAVVTAAKYAGLEIAFEASNAADAVAKAKVSSADAAILDLHLGDGPTGLDVAAVLRRANPKVGLVFLTSFEDPRLLHASLPEVPAGSQYLVKSELKAIGMLLSAVKAALEGAAGNVGGSRLGKLTDNQIEILKLVARGHSNAEIAKQRFVTEKSIEVAISRIAKALDLNLDSSQNQRVHMAQVYFRASGNAAL
jgi:DNA-binding NarL/FixJ family response regulator